MWFLIFDRPRIKGITNLNIFFHFYFLNMNTRVSQLLFTSFNHLKLCVWILKVFRKGVVSQISNLGHSSHFMAKRESFFVIFNRPTIF